MHDPEFSAEKQSCYRLRCWASTWIHGNSFHPLWFFSRPSLTPMTKKMFLLSHICPWSIEYFCSSKQSPKGHVSVYVRAGQFCLNSCHVAEKKRFIAAAQNSAELNDRCKAQQGCSLGSWCSSGLIKMFFMHISHSSNCPSLFPHLPPSSHQGNVCYPLKQSLHLFNVRRWSDDRQLG